MSEPQRQQGGATSPCPTFLAAAPCPSLPVSLLSRAVLASSVSLCPAPLPARAYRAHLHPTAPGQVCLCRDLCCASEGQQGSPSLELVLLQAATSRRATLTGPLSAGIVRDTSRNSPALLCSQRLIVSRDCADFSPDGVFPVLPPQATFYFFLNSAACPCCLQEVPCLPNGHLLCTRGIWDSPCKRSWKLWDMPAIGEPSRNGTSN